VTPASRALRAFDRTAPSARAPIAIPQLHEPARPVVERAGTVGDARQTAHLWSTRPRRLPTSDLPCTRPRRLWRWSDVAEWLGQLDQEQREAAHSSPHSTPDWNFGDRRPRCHITSLSNRCSRWPAETIPLGAQNAVDRRLAATVPADPAAEARHLLPAAQSEQIFRGGRERRGRPAAGLVPGRFQWPPTAGSRLNPDQRSRREPQSSTRRPALRTLSMRSLMFSCHGGRCRRSFRA
jgi:hypothetical protein